MKVSNSDGKKEKVANYFREPGSNNGDLPSFSSSRSETMQILPARPCGRTVLRRAHRFPRSHIAFC
jgi:hypothetical protein